MSEQIIANLKTALESVSQSNEERYINKIVDDELWDGLKRDFQRSILFQLKRDKFGTKADGNAISYCYTLKEPFKRFFNNKLFKRLVSETFGWSAHWRFIEPDQITIDSRKAIQAFQILYEKYSQEDPQLLENNEFIKEYDLQDQIVEVVESDDDDDDEETEELLSVRNYIKKFHQDCIFHTDEINEPHAIPSVIAFYMFYYYINYESDGKYPDIKFPTITKLLNKEMQEYENTHKLASGKKLNKIKRTSRVQYYINIQIRTPLQRWYPANKRVSADEMDQTPVRVHSTTIMDRLKRRKVN